MFRIERKRNNSLTAAYDIVGLIYHTTVRDARGKEANALFGLIMNIVQSVIFILAIYFSMSLLGAISPLFRGDFVVFLVSGVMSYMTYNKTMKGVYGAAGPTSPMMQHGPMTTAIAITSAALSTLYQQVLTTFVILSGYHLAFKPVSINDPAFAFFMMILAWFFGIATGMCLLAIRPWAPKFAPVLMTIVSRVNVFASGKMMVGNTLSFTLLRLFDWNPLFHTIDQMRGAIFINYVPRNSSVPYVIYVTLAMLAIGLMGEFFSRQHTSASWFKR